MNTTKKTFAVYWQHTKPYKKRLYVIYPLMVVAQVVEDFVQPLLISGILTKLATGNKQDLVFSRIWPILALIIVCEVVGHLLWNRVIVPIFWRTQDEIMRDINITVFQHLANLHYRFFANRFSGSLVNQTNKFVGSFERLTDALTWNMFKLIVAFAATSIILLPKVPYVVFALLMIAAIYIPLVWRYRQKLLPYNQKWAASESSRTGQLADSLSNIAAVKAFAREQLELKRMTTRANKVHQNSIATMKVNMRQELVSGSLQRAINVVTIIASVLLAVNGKIEIGVIYLSLNFTMGIMRRLWDLNNTFRTFTRVFGDTHDMAEILDITPEVQDPTSPLKLSAIRGDISIKNITYRHEEATEDLFKYFSLHIKPGEKIGLVGKSGSGKTTLVNLLLRFMDINDGQICIDGTDITKTSQHQLRSAITYVPQEPLLFHRSIYDNIAYGNKNATKEMVEAAAKMANAHEFISELPDGYNCLVGERGVKLSGGQKQRVAIARAMIKNAPILILDEATSALDSESEALIQDALMKLLSNKTAIVIAHRLSTIQKMDRIVVMDEGKIVESDSHEQLIRQNGVYASLWKRQSGGFLKD